MNRLCIKLDVAARLPQNKVIRLGRSRPIYSLVTFAHAQRRKLKNSFWMDLDLSNEPQSWDP